MVLHNVVLSTEPRNGKGGVATVVPMYLEALDRLGTTRFIATHAPGAVWGKFGPWLLAFFRCTKVLLQGRHDRVVFHLHPGSGLCLLRMLGLALFLRGMARQAVFVYLHTPHLERYLAARPWRFVIAGLVRWSSRTVVLTRYAYALLDQYGMAAKAVVIPNPWRVGERDPGEREWALDETLVLTLGRLVPGKGFVETVRAMACLPAHYRLVIAGEGELLDPLRRDVARLGLQRRVAFAGWVTGPAKASLLEAASVFCLPSRVDSFGMSFVEAQCFDLPIVAFGHPPVMEVIQPGRAVFVDTLEPTALAAAIERAVRLAGAAERGSGRRWIDASFGIDRISLLLREAIDTLPRRPGAASV